MQYSVDSPSVVLCIHYRAYRYC